MLTQRDANIYLSQLGQGHTRPLRNPAEYERCSILPGKLYQLSLHH